MNDGFAVPEACVAAWNQRGILREGEIGEAEYHLRFDIFHRHVQSPLYEDLDPGCVPLEPGSGHP